MDGFSAIGLALAVVPIVTSAAGGYRAFASTTRQVFSQEKKDGKAIECHVSLQEELVLFSLSLKKVLRDLPGITDDVLERVTGLESDFWNTDHFKEALRRHLGDSYESFHTSIRIILDNLEEIISSSVLHLSRADLVAVNHQRLAYTKLQELIKKHGDHSEGFRARVRFTTKEGKIRKCLRRLKEKNEFLERLTIAAAPIEHTVLAVVGGDEAPSRDFCEMAGAVHRLLASQLSCKCPDKGHNVRLCMNLAREKGTNSSPLRMDMFISMTRPDSTEEWQSSTIHISVEVIQSANTQTARAPSVHFQPSTQDQSTTTRRKSSADFKILRPVTAICEMAQQACQNNVTLEMILGGNRTLPRLYSTRAERERVRVQTPNATLYAHLQSAQLMDRRILAVILAHGLLHLKESPWLEDDWSNQLYFMSSVDGKPDFKRPFLAADVRAANRSSSQDSTGANMLVHESPPLLALGVLLLELAISADIESKKSTEDILDGQIHNTDLFTATKILRESHKQMAQGYYEAVMACLHPQRFIPPNQALDFGDETVRRLVHRHIIAPLEEELYASWPYLRDKFWDGGFGG